MVRWTARLKWFMGLCGFLGDLPYWMPRGAVIGGKGGGCDWVPCFSHRLNEMIEDAAGRCLNLLHKMRVSCSACADWPRALQKHKQAQRRTTLALTSTQVARGRDAERLLTRERLLHTHSACLSTAARAYSSEISVDRHVEASMCMKNFCGNHIPFRRWGKARRPITASPFPPITAPRGIPQDKSPRNPQGPINIAGTGISCPPPQWGDWI